MTILLAAAAMAAQNSEVELARVFTAGKTESYEIKAHILAERKSAGMSFFLPEEFDVKYGFSVKVENARPDGFGVVLYERPSMTFIEGETADHGPKSTVEKTNWKYRLTLSPINELTDMQDLTPKKPEKKPGSGGGLYVFGAGSSVQQDFIGRLVQELHSLAMFLGNLDSSLDFSPKLPLDAVKPGATWKKTVSYQPRELKGSDKQVVQRLDYTYTYVGLGDWNGKKVHKVKADLDLDTDAAKFINQALDMKPEESGLKELRLQMKASIVFNLDEKTKTTLEAVADAKGGFKVVSIEDPDEPVFEEKITGKSTLTFLGAK